MGRPKIRFEGYSEDWEQRKLGDSCKLNGRIGFRGYTEKDIVTKEAGGVLTFSPTNIVDNKLTMECKNTYITREKYDESPEIKISNGDILFVKTGSTLGKSALVIGLKEDASINPQIVVMRVEKDTETFMSNVLITDGVMKQVAAVKIGGAVPTMTETELKNFTYFAPTEKEEKKKIGNYFRTLDHLITLHQRKCDETKTLKKYMLQKMFPQNGEKVPEIRFDGFTEDWEQRKVTELLKNSSSAMKIGPFGSALKKDYFVEEGIKVYAQENAFTGDFSMGDYYITEDKYKELKSCELYPGDLVISMMGTIGACAIFPENAEKGIMNSHLLRLQFNNEVIPEYIMYLLRDSDLIRKQIDRLSVGSIMSGLSSSVVKKLVFPIPKLAEQKKIVKYLDSIDHLITLHQRKCNDLKEIKKYMLQNMFV